MPTKKSVSCCDGKCCCCGHKWTIVAVILIVAAVAYFAYGEYMKYKSSAPYTVKETNGVTTVSPGPGLVPDGPPSVNPPTTPAPKN